MVLLDVAPNRVDPRHARHALDLWPDNPVLDSAKIRGTFELGCEPLALGSDIAAIALPTGFPVGDMTLLRGQVVDAPHIDLTETSGDRTHFRLCTRRQARPQFKQSLTDLLTRKIDVGPISKDCRNLRKSISRERARVLKTRYSSETILNSERHLPFDLYRRQRGHYRIDLNLIVGDVWHRINRDLAK